MMFVFSCTLLSFACCAVPSARLKSSIVKPPPPKKLNAYKVKTLSRSLETKRRHSATAIYIHHLFFIEYLDEWWISTWRCCLCLTVSSIEMEVASEIKRPLLGKKWMLLMITLMVGSLWLSLSTTINFGKLSRTGHSVVHLLGNRGRPSLVKF